MTQQDQKELGRTPWSIDELITAQADKIEALKAQKKGLMQGLFPVEVEK